MEGRLRSRTYEGRDGQTRFSNEINLTDVRFLDRGQGRDGDAAPYGDDSGAGGFAPPADDIDDLPF